MTYIHYPEEAMAPHSSVLAWRIPGTGEYGGLLSMGSHRVGHDCSDLAAAAYTLACVKRYLVESSTVVTQSSAGCSVMT